jgi:hypothetical protein
MQWLLDKWKQSKIYYDMIVKNTFGFTILYWYSLQWYWQVLQTSTGLDWQFSAPFKAGNSRQVQTCYKPTVQTQRKLQHFLVYTSTGEMGVLMTLKHWVSTQWRSPLCVRKHFHFWRCISSGIFVLAEWNNTVITIYDISSHTSLQNVVERYLI